MDDDNNHHADGDSGSEDAVVTVWVTNELDRKIEREADAEGVGKSDVVREVCREQLTGHD